ncbi:hypothetical protein [Leucobacter luti]|nr:hypothetical protein [Leucobacter luti]
MAVSAPYRKSPGENEDAMQVTATYERRDSMREIEGETREELDAQVPEGWQVLGIWRD